MKKFKAKKKSSKNIVLFIGLFLMSMAFSIKYLCRENLINNNAVMDALISDFVFSSNKKLTNVDFLLKYALNIGLENSEIAFNEQNEEDNTDIEDNEKDNEKGNELIVQNEELVPLVYIYNTHQTEKYKSNYLENYNISSTVLTAANILKEYLEDLGIGVIVEQDDVAAKLHSLNWKYGYSYKVSRMFMESAKEKNPSLKYFIDLHRDSSVYEKTTTEIDGEKWVKILFVVGLDNKNYEPNLKLAEDLSTILKRYNANLYRGIMKKSGAKVNGVYNQDFNPNTMLIEVGGQYNNISEVNNTLKVFAQVLFDYIKEKENA